jgi:hypothetical protein
MNPQVPNAVLAVATFLLVIGAFVFLLMNWLQTRVSLRAIQLDHEYAWRPHLVVEDVEVTPPSSGSCVVRNIGRGPALRVRVVHTVDGSGPAAPLAICNVTRADIGAGMGTRMLLTDCLGTERIIHLHAGLPEGISYDEPGVWLCICDDIFGAMYLFQSDRAPVLWHEGDPSERPPWTRYRFTSG